MEHTKVPWIEDRAGNVVTCDDGGALICECHQDPHWQPDGVHMHPNAAFIVRACNAHDDLLAAGKAMLEALANCPGEFNYPVLIEIELRTAIAKAGG